MAEFKLDNLEKVNFPRSNYVLLKASGKINRCFSMKVDDHIK